MFKSRSKAGYKLGIYKAPSGLRGALVRHQDGKAELIRVFGGGEKSFSESGPELSSVSIGPGFGKSFKADRNGSGSFGASQGGGGYAAILGGDGSAGVPDVFLSSEFGRMPVTTSEPSGIGQDLLKEDFAKILARCRELGVEDLDVVWCLGTSHFSWAEISGPTKEGSAKKGRHRSVTIDAAPADDGSIRRIECTPKKEEPASAVIEALRSTPGQPGICVVDSEVSSFLALMKIAQGEEAGVSLFVRLSEDDLLVLATRDGRLQQVDVLRSLSVLDGPEMLYSRLLLLLDEFGLPNIDRLFIASLEEDPRFVDTFETYFRGVEVADLRDKLGRISSSDDRVEGEALPAIGAALRDLLDLKPDENMLAQLLRKPRQSNPFSLSVMALLAVLALTAVFFVARYAHFDREISSRHNRIQALTHDTKTASLLRHRIDSLQAAYSVNMQGLQVIDSLLVGSDKWTRTFDETATAMSQVGGIWMEKWQPAGSIVDISGGARTRAGVVELARRLNGTIETITYPSGNQTHYSFRMKAPVVVELPEAARYLRERAVKVTQL